MHRDGDCAVVYFTHKHRGWSATLRHGEYKVTDGVDIGVIGDGVFILDG